VARDAFVSLPEISLGIPLTWGTLPRLVNLVGPAKAKRLSILCERVDADAALRMGLVDEVCDKGMSLEVAQRLARSALEKPRHSVRMTKEAVNAYAGIGAHAVSYMAHDQLELAAASPESRAARDQALRRRKAPPS
jgi:enoyl-CoA hydratase/carnithine racemase